MCGTWRWRVFNLWRCVVKCVAQTSRWGVKPCPNNAKCDGYCYAHHPSVVLAKLRLYQREGRTHLRCYIKENGHVVGEFGSSIRDEIESQERILRSLGVAP